MSTESKNTFIDKAYTIRQEISARNVVTRRRRSRRKTRQVLQKEVKGEKVGHMNKRRDFQQGNKENQ